jgi:tRNA(Phe) wybutosine-synthesizing methylase Tyw3
MVINWEPHKTKNIVLKKANIDEAIIPVIKWLNSLPGVWTEHSCEGNQPRKDQQRSEVARPYVVFYCHNPVSLVNILSEVEIGTVTVKLYNGHVRYNLKFHSKDDLLFHTKAISWEEYYNQKPIKKRNK